MKVPKNDYRTKNAEQTMKKDPAAETSSPNVLAEPHVTMGTLNHRPRKTLGYRTPDEVFFGTTASLTVAPTSCIQVLILGFDLFGNVQFR
jgi:hypothetical protein